MTQTRFVVGALVVLTLATMAADAADSIPARWALLTVDAVFCVYLVLRWRPSVPDPDQESVQAFQEQMGALDPDHHH